MRNLYLHKEVHVFDSNSPSGYGWQMVAITTIGLAKLGLLPANLKAKLGGLFLEDIKSSFEVCDCVA